jgi:hypothetical protein
MCTLRIYQQYMNIRANDVCKSAKNMLEKYKYIVACILVMRQLINGFQIK